VSGGQVWEHRISTIAAGGVHPGGLAVLDGVVYVAGQTGGTISADQPSAGGVDAFLAKLDAAGNLLWTRQFGTAANDSVDAGGVAADEKGVYVSGQVGGALPGQTHAGRQDVFLRRYDPDGDERFTHQFGTPGRDNGPALAVEKNRLWLGGRVEGALPGHTFAGGTGDAFLIKFPEGFGTR